MRTRSSDIFTKNTISFKTFILFLSVLKARKKIRALNCLINWADLNMKGPFHWSFYSKPSLGHICCRYRFPLIDQFEKDTHLLFDAVCVFRFVNYWKFQVSRSVQNVSELQSALLLKNKHNLLYWWHYGRIQRQCNPSRNLSAQI